MTKEITEEKTKLAEMGLVTDAVGAFKATIDDVTGFLTAPVVLSRTGVQHYFGYELGLKDRALEKIGVFRSPEEVFHADSVKSFINLVATDDHPSELVDINNVKKLQKGTVSHVVKVDNKTLDGIITITDSSQISKVKGGKVEVSVGYSNDLVPLVGTDEGNKYEFAQTNIRANHLAIVDAGRCGAACKLTLDDHKKKENNMVKITLQGITFDAEDNLAQAIAQLQVTHDEEKTALQKKLDKEELAKKEAMKEKDEAEAKKDAVEKEKMTDADIDKLVSAKASLLSQVSTILGDKMPKCVNCDQEMKILVVEDVLPDMDLKDKTTEYINASYDIAVEKYNKGKKSTGDLNVDFSNIKSTDLATDREAPRTQYAKDMGLEV